MAVYNYNVKRMYLYKNGVLFSSPSASNIVYPGGDEKFYVGSSGEGTSFLTSKVDEVKIYNRALSSSEILKQYNDSKHMYSN